MPRAALAIHEIKDSCADSRRIFPSLCRKSGAVATRIVNPA